MGKHSLSFLSSPSDTYGGVTLGTEKDRAVWDRFIEHLHCDRHVPNRVLFFPSKTLEDRYYYSGFPQEKLEV